MLLHGGAMSIDTAFAAMMNMTKLDIAAHVKRWALKLS